MKKKSNTETTEDLTGGNRGNGESRDGSATLTDGARVYVRITQLQPDPLQPRKFFDEQKLQEMGETIKAHGIVQDIVVQPTKGNWFLDPGVTHKKGGGDNFWQWLDRRLLNTAEQKYEGPMPTKWPSLEEAEINKPLYDIVDGERRWRAAQLAGLETVPIAVRAVNEEKKLALQILVNQQHENLSALEEAETYRRMLDSGKKAEDIAKELGVSRATVFTRVSLTRLHAPVREAVMSGKLAVTVAGLIAMIPEPRQQEKALKQLTDEESYRYPYSFRDAQVLIEEEYCKALKDCGFETSKTYEGTFANGEIKGDLKQRGPCTTCQYRTGNMVEAFPELTKRPNVCTQPSCYAAKRDAHRHELVTAARAEGKTVLDAKTKVFANYGRLEAGYVRADESIFYNGGYKSYQQLLGKALPEPLLAVNDEGELEKVWDKRSMTAALKEKGIDPNAQEQKDKEKRQKQEAKKKARQAVGELIQAKVFQKLVAMPTDAKTEHKLWSLMVKWASEVYYGNAQIEKLVGVKEGNINNEALLKKLPLQTVRAAAIAMLMDGDGDVVDYNGDWNETLVQLCEVTGVDLKKEETAVPVKPAEKAEKKSKKNK